MTYTFQATRVASSNAELTALIPMDGLVLTPAFSPTISAYRMIVLNRVSSVRFKATKSFTYSPIVGYSVQINGAHSASDQISSPVPLTEGANTTISVVVTAQDGLAYKIYRIVAYRGASSNAYLSDLDQSIGDFKAGHLSPAFSPNTFYYTVNVAYNVAGMRITAYAAHHGATLNVIEESGASTPVRSGQRTSLFPVKNSGFAATTTLIKVLVTAQDGTSKSYTIGVIRASPAQRKEVLLAFLTFILTVTMGAHYMGFAMSHNPKAVPGPIEDASFLDDLSRRGFDVTRFSQSIDARESRQDWLHGLAEASGLKAASRLHMMRSSEQADDDWQNWKDSKHTHQLMRRTAEHFVNRAKSSSLNQWRGWASKRKRRKRGGGSSSEAL